MTIHIDEFGSGPAVVILHGTPTAPGHMVPLAVRLGRGGRRALVVHLPGYGRSAGLRPYSLERVYELVEDALLERGVDTADFVGFSYGAYRSVALACRARVRARSVASLAGYADQTEADRVRLRGLVSMIRDRVDLAPLFEDLMLSPAGRADPEAVTDVRSWATAVTPEDLLAEGEAAIDSPDLLPELARLSIPVLARVGALDAGCPPACSRRITDAARFGSLEIVPNVSHAILREDFEATAASVERHLSGATPP